MKKSYSLRHTVQVTLCSKISRVLSGFSVSEDELAFLFAGKVGVYTSVRCVGACDESHCDESVKSTYKNQSWWRWGGWRSAAGAPAATSSGKRAQPTCRTNLTHSRTLDKAVDEVLVRGDAVGLGGEGHREAIVGDDTEAEPRSAPALNLPQDPL
mgnify:CR=1 FL=1